jgi:hypothetical protein
MTIKTEIKAWRIKNRFDYKCYDNIFEELELQLISYLKRNTKIKI